MKKLIAQWHQQIIPIAPHSKKFLQQTSQGLIMLQRLPFAGQVTPRYWWLDVRWTGELTSPKIKSPFLTFCFCRAAEDKVPFSDFCFLQGGRKYSSFFLTFCRVAVGRVGEAAGTAPSSVTACQGVFHLFVSTAEQCSYIDEVLTLISPSNHL